MILIALMMLQLSRADVLPESLTGVWSRSARSCNYEVHTEFPKQRCTLEFRITRKLDCVNSKVKFELRKGSGIDLSLDCKFDQGLLVISSQRTGAVIYSGQVQELGWGLFSPTLKFKTENNFKFFSKN
jgi:hypothetical protein